MSHRRVGDVPVGTKFLFRGYSTHLSCAIHGTVTGRTDEGVQVEVSRSYPSNSGGWGKRRVSHALERAIWSPSVRVIPL